MAEPIDVAVSFDTTGSMFPCLTQVRRCVEQLTNTLFDRVPGIRMAIMSHGDYCDGPCFLTVSDFMTDRRQVCKAIKEHPQTHGGDAPEAYEYVLQKARSLNWSAGRNRALVMIGDDVPHQAGSTHYGVAAPSWKNEASLLKEMGVTIYAVQALGRSHANQFWDDLGDFAIDLDQFAHVADMLTGIVMQRAGQLDQFQSLLRPELREAQHVVGLVDILQGKKRSRVRNERKKSEYALHAVHPSRFQVLDVDYDCKIQTFVQDNGLTFKKGRGFYEFTKSVKIQSYKEVVIQDRMTGEMFTGEKAREILGIPVGVDARVRPGSMDKYRGFIQSTSYNRKLLAGTAFLYEVDDVR